MKFLLISPLTSTSGSAIRFWNIARQLKLAGHDVLYVERSPKDSPPPLYPDIKYKTSPKLKNLFFDIAYSTLFNFIILFKNLDCDIYYALKPAPNNGLPALMAKLLGKKIILDIDDLDYAYFKPGVAHTISKFFFDGLPRFFPLITCHTKNLQGYIYEKLKIPIDRVLFLAQGVSDEFLNYKTQNKITVNSKTIIYVATLGITSELDDLFPMFRDLCELHPDLQITIVGDGVKRRFFEEEIRIAGIMANVNFTGRIDHKELPALIASHRIGINYMRRSLVNDCRAILKIREYLALGLDVVCNDVGDAEVFKDFAYVETSIEGMKACCEQLLLNINSPTNVAGQNYVLENFRWVKVCEKLLQIQILK